MDLDWEINDDEDENDEDTFSKDSTFVRGRDALILLVDATEPMFKPCEEDSKETPFQICMKCARNTLANKIISSDKDLFGIILYGTDEKKNDSDLSHVYVSLPLEPPSDKAILEVEELMDTANFKYGHSTDFTLSDALWTCSMLFNKCSYKLAHKEVVILTNNPRPHAANPDKDKLTWQKAKDMVNLGIYIDLVPLGFSSQQPFDLAPFYKDIIHRPSDEDVGDYAVSSRLEDLLMRVRYKHHKKRPLASLKFTLAPGVEPAVQIFGLVHEAKKPFAVKLDKASNTQLRSSVKYFLTDTGEMLMPMDLKKCMTFAGKDICMTLDETKQIKSLYEPGLCLLGFKGRDELKLHHHLRPSLFLSPHNGLVSGSGQLLAALHAAMVRQDAIAFCRYTARKHCPTRLVALLPQEEDPKAGFHLVFLPFADDVRPLRIKNKVEPSSELVNTAKEIVQRLSKPFDPADHENPVLQKHWRNVEALALNRSEPEDMKDTTLPDEETIKKEAGELLMSFRKLAFGDEEIPGVGEKKKLASKSTQPSKRIKLEGDSPIDVKKEAEAKQLGHLTVAVLREFCRKEGIKSGTKKSDIIDAIYQHLNISPT